MAALTVLIYLPVSIRAEQHTPFSPRIAVFVGGSLLTSGQPFVRFGNGATIGIRGALDVADEWSVEGGYDFSPSSLRLTTADDVFSVARRFDIRIHRLDVGILRYFTTDGGLRPFVTVGIGVAEYAPTGINDFRGSPKTAFVFGGGLEARFSPVLGIRAGMRDSLTGTPTFGVPASYPPSGLVHDFETSIGIIFHLP